MNNFIILLLCIFLGTLFQGKQQDKTDSIKLIKSDSLLYEINKKITLIHKLDSLKAEKNKWQKHKKH